MLLAAALALTACSGGDDEAAEGGGGDVGAVAGEAEAGGGGEGGAEPVARGAASRGSTLPGLGPRVIQTASLTLSVPRNRFGEAIDEARSLAVSFGGFVVGSTASQGREKRLVRGTLVLRVPERSYAEAMEAFAGLGRVESRQERGEDVSQEFVDLEARARHLEAVERQLLELLEKTNTVASALAVQSQLNGVQLELEQVRGRLQFLRDQVAYATISLAIHERQVAVDADDGDAAWGIVDAWRTAAHGFVTVVGWILVAAATIAPLALLLALGFLAARLVLRRHSIGAGARR
jgi:hypothetical protein